MGEMIVFGAEGTDSREHNWGYCEAVIAVGIGTTRVDSADSPRLVMEFIALTFFPSFVFLRIFNSARIRLYLRSSE